jgi:hypothetical protein
MTETTPREAAVEEIAAYITGNRAALDSEYVLDVLNRGLPHLIFALDAIIDSIDSRLGDIEKRLDAAGILRPDGGVPDDEEWKYFALYTLNEPPRCYGAWERDRRGWDGVPGEFTR